MHSRIRKPTDRSSASKNPNTAAGKGGDLTRPPAWAAGLSLQQKLIMNEPGGAFGQGADAVANRVRRMPEPAVQRDETSSPSAEVAEFEEDRRRFEAAQTEFFGEVGETIRQHILQAAGFGRNQRPSTPEEALRVVGRWGVTLDRLLRDLPQITQSLAGQVRGTLTEESLDQRQQSLIGALTPTGQQTYQRMLQRVRSEPFWARHLDSNVIHIFPDLSGANRYGGYTQTGTYQTPEGLTRRSYIVHISKDRLNSGEVNESAATLIHELSHTLYAPTASAEALRPFTRSLAELVADHPQIAALRQSAPDAQQARRIHVSRISQILYEHTGYAEAEIFVHLQQLTHQPPVREPGGTVQPHHYILAVVEGYVANLRRIGMPPRILNGILNSLARRVAFLYDRRIEAAPAGSTQRRLLGLSKEQALTILRLARSAEPR